MVLLLWAAVATLGPLFIVAALLLAVKSMIFGPRCRYCDAKRANVKVYVPPAMSMGGISGFYCARCAEKAVETATTPERAHMSVRSLSPFRRVLAAL